MPYLLIGVGGFVGAIVRFEVGRWTNLLVSTSFPLATFLINVSGSFLLGIVGTIAVHRASPSAEAMRLALGVGFLGAYTTFSTFELETHTLFEDSAGWLATAYVAASVVVGLLAVRIGIALTKAWLL